MGPETRTRKPPLAVETINNCRTLRRTQTNPERILWRYLRDRRLCGVKFRRQHPIGPYIADFCCSECGLVIELDGVSHEYTGEHDTTRQKQLEAQGFRILRLPNERVLKDIRGVLDAIVSCLPSEVAKDYS